MVTKDTLEKVIDLVEKRHSIVRFSDRLMEGLEIAKMIGVDQCSREDLGDLASFAGKYGALLEDQDGWRRLIESAYARLEKDPMQKWPKRVAGWTAFGTVLGYISMNPITGAAMGFALGVAIKVSAVRHHNALKKQYPEPLESALAQHETKYRQKREDLLQEYTVQKIERETYMRTQLPLAALQSQPFTPSPTS